MGPTTDASPSPSRGRHARAVAALAASIGAPAALLLAAGLQLGEGVGRVFRFGGSLFGDSPSTFPPGPFGGSPFSAGVFSGSLFSASPAEVDRFAAGGVVLLALAVVAWWLLAWAAAVASALLHRAGRPAAARRVGRLSPRSIRRVAAAALGVHLVLAPAAHADAPFHAPVPVPAAVPVPAVGAEAAAGAKSTESGDGVPDPRWTPERPATPLERVLGGGRDGAAREAEGAAQEVVVRAGDSLWSVAARSLGGHATAAEIAREWPRWYRANRAAVGETPTCCWSEPSWSGPAAPPVRSKCGRSKSGTSIRGSRTSIHQHPVVKGAPPRPFREEPAMSASPDASHPEAGPNHPTPNQTRPNHTDSNHTGQARPIPHDSGPAHLAARPAGPQVPRTAVRRFADVVPLRRTDPPSARSAAPWPGPHRVPVPAGPVPGSVPGAAPAPGAGQAEADRAEQRQVAQVVHMVAQAVFESLAGARPVHQLARWLDAENFEKLRLRVELTRAARPARTAGARGPVVRRTRVCRVAEGCYEAAVVVAEPERVRAAALRIERRRGQWRVCELEIG
ncbi:hypothetical protein GCM10023081_21500 [Arthrobacter ginkgonis]|uniref:LysM domain-containing protein n=1 Tax=Arthrobacter ginkgonis TaxID=1630594 RepID=A0ABP7CBR7_9MICC